MTQPRLTRRSTWLLLAMFHILLATVVSTDAGPPAPVHDNFASAKPLAGQSGSDKDTNVGATLEPGEPEHGLVRGGASVWYSWTAPVSGRAVFETTLGTLDSIIAIYRGTSVQNLTQIAQDDDGGEDQIGTSRVAFNVTAGSTYHIAVDGFKGVSGSVVLSWSMKPGQPANDNFSQAQSLAGDSGAIDGTTIGASRQPGEPMHLFPGESSVWYRWLVSEAGRYFIKSEGADFDLLLAVYTGESIKSLEPVESAHNGEYGNDAALEFEAKAKQLFYIAVDAGSNSAGKFKLKYGKVENRP